MSIKVGDLVMVLGSEACGCAGQEGGGVFVVEDIYMPDEWQSYCQDCFRRVPICLTASMVGYTVGDVSVYRLKKIDPLSEPDAQEAQAEFTRDKKKRRELEYVEALRK